MAKNVRISDALYELALAESRLETRSIAQQLEHWAKLGMAASLGGSVSGHAGALAAALEMTRRLDIVDVQAGKRSADSLHFVPRSMARKSRPVFPATYRKD